MLPLTLTERFENKLPLAQRYSYMAEETVNDQEAMVIELVIESWRVADVIELVRVRAVPV